MQSRRLGHLPPTLRFSTQKHLLVFFILRSTNLGPFHKAFSILVSFCHVQDDLFSITQGVGGHRVQAKTRVILCQPINLMLPGDDGDALTVFQELACRFQQISLGRKMSLQRLRTGSIMDEFEKSLCCPLQLITVDNLCLARDPLGGLNWTKTRQHSWLTGAMYGHGWLNFYSCLKCFLMQTVIFYTLLLYLKPY